MAKKVMSKEGNPLNAKKMGLAGGFVLGDLYFIFTIISLATGWGTEFFSSMGNLYLGYSVSIGGAILSWIYGFIDGFIVFGGVAWTYNWLQRK